MSIDFEQLPSEQQIRVLQSDLVEVTLIAQETLGALSQLVGQIEKLDGVEPFGPWRPSIVHADLRLRDVLRHYLGEEAGQESDLSF